MPNKITTVTAAQHTVEVWLQFETKVRIQEE